VDEKNDQIAHRRIVAGREILMNYGRNNNSPETGSLRIAILDPTKLHRLPILPSEQVHRRLSSMWLRVTYSNLL
jgi:hypothetical protein